ncbi:hypothetical protein ASE19_11580 [Nocardioides sp. Root79]|nr:hypothetical protein ASE19_11580 [Nocardioides sp. Root79]KRC72555.1 hypothetical protein ASE20_08110 [Nocardioides sp. Root240]
MLVDAGFTRKGRKFSIEAPDGSTGEIEVVRSLQGRHEAEFQVDFFVSPRVWAEYQLCANGIQGAHLWFERLRGVGDGTPWDSQWSFDVADERAGARLREAIEQKLLEQLPLLDQANLLNYSRKPRSEARGVTARREVVVPALLAAQGPSIELDEMLAGLGNDPERREADEKFVAFIREWLAENYR